MKYRIESLKSGNIFGIYDGETEADAMNAMARDAGYHDASDAAKQIGDLGDHLLVIRIK